MSTLEIKDLHVSVAANEILKGVILTINSGEFHAVMRANGTEKSTLEINELRVSVEGNEILQGVHLKINGGEFHAVMGPNGTGPSTLSPAIMGHPAYEVTKGSIHIDGEDVLEMDVDGRARAGLFL